MIPLDIDDTTVLRRTLEEIEGRIPVLDESARPITTLQSTAGADEVLLKLNEVILSLNLVLKSMDRR